MYEKKKGVGGVGFKVRYVRGEIPVSALTHSSMIVEPKKKIIQVWKKKIPSFFLIGGLWKEVGER